MSDQFVVGGVQLLKRYLSNARTVGSDRRNRGTLLSQIIFHAAIRFYFKFSGFGQSDAPDGETRL